MKVAVLGAYSPSLINFRGPLIRSILDAGHDVIAMAPEMDPDTRVALQEMGIEVVEVPLHRRGMNPVRDLTAFAGLWRIFRKHQPDVVLSYTIKPVSYGSLAAWFAGVKNIYAMVEGAGYAFNGTGIKRSLLGALAGVLYRKGMSVCRSVFFLNSDNREFFRKWRILPKGTRTCLVNGTGIDLDHYQLEPMPERDAPEFLCIARLLKEKGVADFAEAARLVKQQYPEATFRLVGPFDPGVDSITEMDVERWKTWMDVPGPTDDVRPDIASCSVYVLPSYHEGVPRTTLEAMSMGRPVITTDAVGCKETVIDGETGFMVPTGDVRALADAMIACILEPEKLPEMAKASRRYAKERFDVHKVNKAMLREMRLAHVVPGDEIGQPAYDMGLKRVFDIAVALPALVIFSPLLLFVAWKVYSNLSKDIVFRQTRPGRDSKPFRIVKFKSMTDERDENGELLPDDVRLTPFGQKLRSTSLDELPELWNVLKGDMSLVGPRPLLMEYLDRYSPEQSRRHAVRPGITGWAQVNGRNNISWQDKLAMDVWYVDNRSFWLDLKILFLTVWKVVRKDDISREGHATTPYFMGNDPEEHGGNTDTASQKD